MNIQFSFSSRQKRKSLWNKVKGSLLWSTRREDFSWGGGIRPRYTLWRRFIQKEKISFTRGSCLHVLTWDYLNSQLKPLGWAEEFKSKKINPLEAALLEQSAQANPIIEVAQLEFILEGGEALLGAIISGQEHSLGDRSMKNLLLNAFSLEKEALRKNKGLKRVNIYHTHPNLELYVEDPVNFKERLILSPLSNSDIQFARKLSSLLKSPVCIHACTPGGISYSFLES